MFTRRSDKRVPLASFSVLRLSDSDNIAPIKALTADISMSGIGVYADTPMEIDQDVLITLTFVGSKSLVTEYIEGRIIYVSKIGEFHFAGIEFRHRIAPSQQPLLYERLQRILNCYGDSKEDASPEDSDTFLQNRTGLI